MMEYQDDDVGSIIRKMVLEHQEKRRDGDTSSHGNIVSMFPCRTNCNIGNMFA